MIPLNLSIEHPPAAVRPERLKAFVLWMLAEAQTVAAGSGTDESVMDALGDCGPSDCYELLSLLPLEEKVRFAILNEFGLGFMQKSCYETLAERVLQRLQCPQAAKPAA